MRTSHVVLAALSITFAVVITRALQHHPAPVPAALQRPAPDIPIAPADMPLGLDSTVQQLASLLETGDAEQALRLCWSPSMLDQMSRSGLFSKCAEMVKADEKLPPTLKRILAVGPTKAYKTQEGYCYAEFDANTPELNHMRFVYLNNHWYVW